MPNKKPLSFEGVHDFLRTLFADDLHAKRVLSLAGATMGVIEAASLAVAMIGKGLALARGRLTKHAISLDAPASGKQVDRLLSNPGIDVDALLVHGVPYGVGSRSSIAVAMDWTDFDADGQAAIMSPAARTLVNLHAKRWGIEGAFRDAKDLRFGMGMGAVHVSIPDRRDRLWLINAALCSCCHWRD